MKIKSPSHWTLRRWKQQDEKPEMELHDPFPGCFCPCHRRPSNFRERMVHDS